MKKAERNYCVTRRELLAVIDRVRHFRHYLYGKKFVVRTDHGALRWLVSFKDLGGQMARWVELLGTYVTKLCIALEASMAMQMPCPDKCSFCDGMEASAEAKDSFCGAITRSKSRETG